MPDDGEGLNRGMWPSGTDPSSLTTQQLVRAIQAERDYVDGQIAVLMERLAGIDKATELRLQGITDIPAMIQEKVDHLSALMTERFTSVAQQFAERDIRAEREARDNKVAVDAAFAAQKEAAAKQNESNTLAITKSEMGTSETINKLAELFKTTTDGLSDKIDDLKERVGRMESVKQGGQQAYAGIYALAGFILIITTIIGVVVAMRT